MKLDHLVYAVPDLARAIEDFERHLGVAPALGGRHLGIGTHNAILPLADETYLELIAIDPDQPAPDQARPFGLDGLEEARLATWAVRSRDIEVDVERARERGYDPGLVLPMTREEPSGEILHWKLSLKPEPFGDGLVPFVIDWQRTPHPSSRAKDPASRCSLSDFSACHPDPLSIAHALEAMNVELEVESSAKVELRARLTGPGGQLELS